jgi:hypothetical protein
MADPPRIGCGGSCELLKRGRRRFKRFYSTTKTPSPDLARVLTRIRPHIQDGGDVMGPEERHATGGDRTIASDIDPRAAAGCTYEKKREMLESGFGAEAHDLPSARLGAPRATRRRQVASRQVITRLDLAD